MTRLMLFLLLSLSACSTAPARDDAHFFDGKASDDCEFIGYLDSSAHEETQEKSYTLAKKDLVAHAKKVKANMLKIVNVNRMTSAVSLSVESYRCSNLLQLKITDDAKLDF
jgi:hypothetical protein